MKKELKEVEEIFYMFELSSKSSNILDKMRDFEKLIRSIRFKEYTEEQMSLVIDKFFENYKYGNDECLIRLFIAVEKYFPQFIDKFITRCFKDGNILIFIYSYKNFGREVTLIKDKLTKNLIDNLSEASTFNLLYYKSMLEDRGDIEKISSELEKRFKINEKENIQQITQDISATFCPLIKLRENINKTDLEKIDAINEFIYLVIKDICRNEEVEISDIEFLGIGATSVALGIGNKVLKLGSERFTERFPNNPYIAPMLLRKKFVVNDNVSYFIEVTEKCKTNINISDEEKDNIIKKLSEIGIKCTDLDTRYDELDVKHADKNFANLGMVLNPKGNIASWKEELCLTDEVLGLDSYRGNEVLKQGDLVIIDNDCIYDISGNNVTLDDYFFDSENSNSRSRKK